MLFLFWSVEKYGRPRRASGPCGSRNSYHGDDCDLATYRCYTIFWTTYALGHSRWFVWFFPPLRDHGLVTARSKVNVSCDPAPSLAVWTACSKGNFESPCRQSPRRIRSMVRRTGVVLCLSPCGGSFGLSRRVVVVT